MTKRLKRILTITFSLILTVSCALSVSLRFVHAELVAPEKEGSRTLLSIYDDELAPGMNVVWDSPLPDSPSPVNLSYVNSDDKDNVSKNIAIDCTRKGSLKTEMYIDFGKEYNIYTGDGFSDEELEDFYKKSSVEFWVKLNDKPGGFFNIYLFQSRGVDFATAPANQRYIRSNIQLTTYVDISVLGKWQYVQIPLASFSSMGEYVNEQNVKVQNKEVDLTRICAIGFAHMMDDPDTKVNPTIQYDDIRFAYNNMDDANLGVTVIPARDYEERKKNARFTTIDIRSFATTGYNGGPGIGWTD